MFKMVLYKLCNILSNNLNLKIIFFLLNFKKLPMKFKMQYLCLDSKLKLLSSFL